MITKRSSAAADAEEERQDGNRRRRRWRRRAMLAVGTIAALAFARRLLARRRGASVPGAGETARVDREGDAAGGGSGIGGKLAGLLAVVGVAVLLRAVRRRL